MQKTIIQDIISITNSRFSVSMCGTKTKRAVIFPAYIAALLSMSGCNFGNENHLLGTWRLTNVVAVSGGNQAAQQFVSTIGPKMIGEKYTFTGHNLYVKAENGNKVDMKVIKYEIKDGGKKIIVVQKQNKFGADVIEYQPAKLSNDYKRAELTSGAIVLYLTKD